MGALVWLTYQGLLRTTSTGLLGDLLQVAVPIAVGVISYFGAASLFKVEEVAYVRSLLSQRLNRSRTSS
jgi:hypothetical protein